MRRQLATYAIFIIRTPYVHQKFADRDLEQADITVSAGWRTLPAATQMYRKTLRRQRIERTAIKLQWPATNELPVSAYTAAGLHVAHFRLSIRTARGSLQWTRAHTLFDGEFGDVLLRALPMDSSGHRGMASRLLLCSHACPFQQACATSGEYCFFSSIVLTPANQIF